MFNFLRNVVKTIWNLVYAMYDGLILILPQHRKLTQFAFLVHPRDITDIYRPYPAFKYLPDKFVLWFVRFLPPITLSKITGVKSVNTGEEIRGYLLSIVLSPEHMKKDLSLVKKRIKQLSLLAQKKGCSLIGLGALLPFLTRYGEDLKGCTKCHITTGHAYTAAAIVKDVRILTETLDLDIPKIKIAIVGAAGSVGSLCAKSFVNINPNLDLLLIDIDQKRGLLNKLAILLKERQTTTKIEIGTDLNLLRKADIVVVVSNAHSSIIHSDVLKKGAIIIDDSQPRNTSPNLTSNGDGFLVIDVLASYPNLDCHFDFGLLKDRPDLSFTCLVETAILASFDYGKDFCIGIVDVDKITEIAEMARRIGVESYKITFTSFSKVVEVGDLFANKRARFNLGIRRAV